MINKMKTKQSLITIQEYVSEIVKEKYHGITLADEIFTLFEKIVDLANDLYEEDKKSQEYDINTMVSMLISLSSRLGIDFIRI